VGSSAIRFLQCLLNFYFVSSARGLPRERPLASRRCRDHTGAQGSTDEHSGVTRQIASRQALLPLYSISALPVWLNEGMLSLKKIVAQSSKISRS
jgi:hypothetical protein